MKFRLVSMRTPADGFPRLTPSASPTVARGQPASPEFMRPNAPVPRPAAVEQRSWEALAIHVDDARRGGSISSPALRDGVRAIVTALRVACITWEEIYTILDTAVMAGSAYPLSHPLEVELHASRETAIVAHMHSWADVLRLAEIENPCEEPR